jgi:hypothetical protein
MLLERARLCQDPQGAIIVQLLVLIICSSHPTPIASIPYSMKLFTDLNLATWPRRVKLSESLISVLSVNINFLNPQCMIALATLQTPYNLIREVIFGTFL